MPAFVRRLAARIKDSPNGSRLAHGAFWSLAGAIISRGSMFVAGFLLARILGKEGFGKLGMVQSTLDMFGFFAGFSMSMTATKFIAEFRARDPHRTGRMIALVSLTTLIAAAAVSFVILFFAPQLAFQKLEAPELGGLLRIGIAFVFLNAINGTLTGILAGLEAFRTIAKVNLCAGFFTVPLILTGVLWRGLEGTVWALGASQLLLCVFNLLALRAVCLREHIEWDGSNAVSEWRVVLQFSLPALLSGSLIAPVSWECNTLLAAQPGGYSQLGIFNAANLWFSLMLFIPGISNQALLPILAGRAKLPADEDDVPARKIMRAAMRVTAWAAVPLTVCICVLSPVIMGLYGSSFAGGWKTLCFAAIGACLAALQMPAANMVIATRSMWLACVITAMWGGTYYGLTRLLVVYGSDGLSLARAAAYAVNLAATLLLLNFRFGKNSTNATA